MFSQNQIRDFKIADPVAAAAVGRPNEVAFIASLNNHFSFVTNGALIADGTTIIPANGLNNFWVLIGTPTIKDNVAAIIAPSAADDASLGYSVGSRWIDTVLDKAYVCLDSTATAAIWQATTIQPYPRVPNFAALPLATVPPAGTVYFVETGTGTFGVARKPAGLWVTNGTTWNYAGTAIDSVSDVNFTIFNAADSTKTIKHSAAAITPGTQRTIIMPDADVKLHKDNMVGILAPTATNDASQGYDVGSVWIDTVLGNVYQCVDATATAAVWNKLNSAAGILDNLTAIIAPVATDDSAAGYAVGSHWVDNVLGVVYVCVDATATAAVWAQVSNANAIQNNYTAIVSPAVTDDITAGYAVGSEWINVTLDVSYVCVDSTATAAIWKETTHHTTLNNLTATGNPSALTDNSSLGYEVGSLWYIPLLGQLFYCADATVGAAVWTQLADSSNNSTALVDPGVTDDTSLGYGINSIWTNTVTDKSWICQNAGLGVAVWTPIDATAAAATPLHYGGLTNTTPQTSITYPYACVFDTVLGATKGLNVSVLNNNVVVLQNGDYLVSFGGSFRGVNAIKTMTVQVNGVNSSLLGTTDAGAGSPNTIASSGILPLVSGDILTAVVTSVADAGVDLVGNHLQVVQQATAEVLPVGNLQGNFAAAAAPTTTDDTTLGYAIGSVWVDTLTDKSYICLDSTATAAVWKETTSNARTLNNYIAVVAPSITDDNVAGYSVGSHWLNTVANKAYICTSATTGAAAWSVLTYVDAPFNYAGTVPPSPTDDITAGYTIGSKWLDTVAESMYVCVNHTAAAAVWHQIDQTVTAGAVTTLDYVYLYDSSAAHAANVNIPLTTFNIVDDAAGLVSAAGITIAKAGRYEIIYTAGVAVSSAGSDTIALYVDGVQVNKTSTGGLAAGNQVPNALTYQATLSVGQVINIRTAIAPVIGDIQLSVKQLPVETVVPAGSAKANFTAIVPPSITDSTANGYALGSQWVDTVANASYICVDATAGAAVWMPVTATSLPKYSASHGAGGGLAVTTGTLINMDATNTGSVIYDPTTMAAGTQVSIASAGDYLIQYSFMSSNTQTNNIRMLLNGVATMQNIQTAGYSGGTSAAIMTLSVGDLITFDTGGALPYGWSCIIAKQA